MNYTTEGAPLPVVICNLEGGETMLTEKGAMSWMSPNMKMETTTGGRNRKNVRSCFFRWKHVYQPLHRAGWHRTDRICIQLSRRYPCIWNCTRAGDCRPEKCLFSHRPLVWKCLFFSKKRIAGGLFGGEGFQLKILQFEFRQTLWRYFVNFNRRYFR